MKRTATKRRLMAANVGLKRFFAVGTNRSIGDSGLVVGVRCTLHEGPQSLMFSDAGLGAVFQPVLTEARVGKHD